MGGAVNMAVNSSGVTVGLCVCRSHRAHTLITKACVFVDELHPSSFTLASAYSPPAFHFGLGCYRTEGISSKNHRLKEDYI